MNVDRVRTRERRPLALVAALFLVPLLMAFLAYYGTVWRPAGRLEHGHLCIPARPLPAVVLPRILPEGARVTPAAAPAPVAAVPALRGQWSLVYAGQGECAAACREMLHVMRQTRLSLGADMTRLERVFLVTADCCAWVFLAGEHADLVVLDASTEAAQPLLRQLHCGNGRQQIRGSDPARPAVRPEQQPPGTAGAHMLYIVDPLGNLVMSYDARKDPHGLHEDLQKLLRLSHIG